MKNKLITIGFMGVKTAFLNVPMEEACRRYGIEQDLDPPTKEQIENGGYEISEFEFDDEFGVYDAWAK